MFLPKKTNIHGPFHRISSHNLTSHQLLTIFLVVEKSKGERSTWSPYIQSLPQTYETPCFASKAEASCFPSFLKSLDSTQRHLIQRKYSQCRQSLVQTATMSFNDFRWAWITVNRWESSTLSFAVFKKKIIWQTFLHLKLKTFDFFEIPA